MNTALATTQSNSQNIEKLKPAFNELAQFLLNNNIKFDETVDVLKSSFIDSARNMNKQKLNKSAISLKTGIDRRQITSKENSSEINPRKKPDPIILILAELRRYQDRKKTTLIKKRAPGDSMVNFCNKYKGRLTAPTIIQELKDMGCIEQISKNEIKILTTSIRLQQSDCRKFDYAMHQFYKLINTLRKNIEEPENSVVEWNVESTKINPENSRLLSTNVKRVRDYLRSHILDAVDAYESDVSDGTYKPYSLNFFINSGD